MPVKSKQPTTKRHVKLDESVDPASKRSASPQNQEAPKRAKLAQKPLANKHDKASYAARQVNTNLETATAATRGRVLRGVEKSVQTAAVDEDYVVVDQRKVVATPDAARSSNTPTIDSADEDGPGTDAEMNEFLDLEAQEDNSPEDAPAPESDGEGRRGSEPDALGITPVDDAATEKAELLALLDSLMNDASFKDRIQGNILARLKTLCVPLDDGRADAPVSQKEDRVMLPPQAHRAEQSRLPAAFGADDEKFNGETSCLDASLWAPVLKKMYRALNPPPRIITYDGRMNGAQLTAPNFQRWAAQADQLGFMLRVLAFGSNAHYVNLSRARWSDLEVVDTHSPGRPLRFLARKRSKTPVLCISLVQVVKSTLLRPAQMPRKTGDGWFDKKSLVANLFAQELELLICTLGCAYGANSIKLPSWSSSDAGRGLTFQTRLSASSGPAAPVKRRGLYAPDSTPGNASGGQVPMQLSASNTVPVIDSTVDGFDLSAPFADVTRRPPMQHEPPPESVGVVFYTVTDQGSEHTIDFNVQAFAWVAHDDGTVYDEPLGHDDGHDDEHGLEAL